MPRVAQFGIALGALGAVLTFMGLFPGVTGLRPAAGIGIMQIFSMLVGFMLLILGALIYVKFTFYSFKPANLAQQIGYRLSLTGLLFAAMAGLSDVLGFGSHGIELQSGTLFGTLQAFGIIGSFLIASIGVLIYAVTGNPEPDEHA